MTRPSLPAPGALLADRYRIVRLIGEGGMGSVFEAENTLTFKRVAIKLMHPSFAQNGEVAQRLVREAQASCRIRHQNVVDVYDVVRVEDALFLVMELLDGEPLSALLERGGVPAHEFIALVLHAMRGVAAGHRVGVIHRDIHPGNILLAREPPSELLVPKVLDFGIAKLRDHHEQALTGSGTTMGTPLYTSYEQLCNARDIDARTDIYPFGVILYQGLTGQQLFEANTLTELLIKLSSETPRPAKQLAPEIPSALDRLISWALERDRDKRIASMDAFINELEPFASARAFRTQMTDAQRTLPAIVPRDRSAPRTPRPSQLSAEAPPPAAMTLPEVPGPEPVPPAGSVSAPNPTRERRESKVLPLAFVAAAMLAVMGLGTLVVGRCSRFASEQGRVAVPPPLPALDAGFVVLAPVSPRAPVRVGSSLVRDALDAAVPPVTVDVPPAPAVAPLPTASEPPAEPKSGRHPFLARRPVKRHFFAGEPRLKDFLPPR